MQNLEITTLDGEKLELNNFDGLMLHEATKELRCVTSKGEYISFDLHKISAIRFIIPMANDLNLAVYSITARKKEEEK